MSAADMLLFEYLSMLGLDNLQCFIWRISQEARVWPRGQPSLGSPEPPLPWDGHARPSSTEDHPDREEYFKDHILLRTKEQTVQVGSCTL